MKSKAQIFGHPIHPMLIPIPIGLWLASLVADIVYLSTRSVFWYDMAWWSMAFGVIGALAAAVPGFIDYRSRARRDPAARRVALTHMVINLSVVVAYLINLGLRYGHAATAGTLLGSCVTLSVVSVLALVVSGWLGGELVYRHGLGVDEETVSITQHAEERTRPRI